MTRREHCLLAAVIILSTSLLWLSSLHSTSQTVPAAVMADGHSARAQKAATVRSWGEAELRHLVKAFDIPAFGMVVIDTQREDAWLVDNGKPVRFDIILSIYWDEPQARKKTAHETAHMLMLANGTHPADWLEGEVAADGFVVCYGSKQAAEYARKWGQNKHPDCQTIGDLVKPRGSSIRDGEKADGTKR